MSDQIDKIIDVSIQRQTSIPSEVSFSDYLISAEFLKADVTPVMDERVREFGSIDEVLDAFGSNHIIYKMAVATLIQNPNISRIFVGRKQTGADGIEDWTTALAAIKAENNEWYGLSCGTRILLEQQEIADWVEANKKLCGMSSADANIINGTGDIAEYLQANSYNRTFVMYHPNSVATPAVPGDDEFPECAWIGKMFANDLIPGSSNWSHFTLAGVTTYSLSGAQYSTAINKRCNLYQEIAGLKKTIFGTVGNTGTFIDLVWGTDWLEAHIQTLTYEPISKLDKVGFTNPGIQTIVGQLRLALQDAVDSGFLAADPEFTVNYPLAANVSSQDKANRNLPSVTFEATLAGAINTVVIRGTLVL